MNKIAFLRDTQDLVKQIETRFLELAARLFIIQKDKMWEESYDSWGEFIDATGIKRPMASVLTRIHEVYVVEGGVSAPKLAAVGYSKLYDAIPLVQSDGVAKAVEMARTLSLGELRQEVRDEKHPNCKHIEVVTICANCHKRVEDHAH